MDNSPKKIVKVGFAVFSGGKILMARSKKNEKIFYFPGGKVEAGESDEDCLRRELMEELGVEPDMNSSQFLGEFIGPAHGASPDVVLVLRMYTGRLAGKPKASSEIAELCYMDYSEYSKISTESGIKVFDWLKEREYIS
ncbi:MAG: NUDIX domain-containing protein [bacterium]|nr:NUDIX domain-containing protein [bacterium]